MVREEEEKSRWWWFESHKSSNHSQWLHSTLAARLLSEQRLTTRNALSLSPSSKTFTERFDHLKSSSDNRSSKFHQEDEPMESVCGSNSHADSEIEDPDEDQKESSPIPTPFQQEIKKINCKEDETWKLEQEIQETDALRRQLLEKDEEKREVIRQLALTVESLIEDNLRLKRRSSSSSSSSVFEFKPMDKFIGKLFYIMCQGKKIV